MLSQADVATAIAAVIARFRPGTIGAMTRLSGGANMESWSIDWDGADGVRSGLILRRAPSAQWSAGRPFDLTVEAGLVAAMHDAGVRAPQVLAVLTPADGLGDGYIMHRVEAEVSPARILADPAPALLPDIAGELARIHAVPVDSLPAAIPPMDTARALADLAARFDHYGGDRPVIALALKWCADHLPEPPERPVLVHGDYRMGNLMADGEGLAAVLDWELAHIGDGHEDLAYGCMTVWRFSGVERPAFGLGSLDSLFAAYEAAGGGPVDRDRFRFWLVYRTLWWALGCLQMGDIWRSGIDAGLERTVISRRTSEQELDLLLLLEEDAPAEERARPLPPGPAPAPPATGEVGAAEMLGAVRDWIDRDIKPGATGRDKFMAAVAMNALGIIARDVSAGISVSDRPLADALRSGATTLAEPGLLVRLRRQCLDKLAADMPKYPALAIARAKWGG